MSTLGELIDQLAHALSGYDAQKDAVAALAADVDSSATTLTLDGADANLSTGLLEVGMELMRVKSYDQTSAVATLFPFGRGYRSTVAAAHTTGDEVRLNPQWPHSTIALKINEVIHELYPRVYAVTTEVVQVPSDLGPLSLNATPAGILGVFVKNETLSTDDIWVREDRWTYDPDRSNNGRNLSLGRQYPPDTEVRVTYAKRPAVFSLTGSLTQEFATETGLELRHEPLILLGVAARMAPFIDVARLPFLSAEARADAQANTAGSAASSARLLYSMFQARLEQEAFVLASEHKIRLHKVV